ncbi:MAG: DUF493 family protein [Cyclobacteriaceae bacterium]
MTEEEIAFKEKLEGAHNFPGSYSFKFIVKTGQQRMVEQLVEKAEVKIKPSSGNKYVSVTLIAQMASSQEIIEVYRKAKKIEGVISL